MRQLLQHSSESPEGDPHSNVAVASVEPVLFVTTPGADPSQELAAFAETQASLLATHGCMHVKTSVNLTSPNQLSSVIRGKALKGNW